MALLAAPADGREHRLALVVAGSHGHTVEVAELAGLASNQMDSQGFFTLIQTPGKFRQALVTRLGHLKGLVAQALRVLGTSDHEDSLVQVRTWELLSRLSVLMPRVEEPDVSDWAHTRNSLVAVARGNDLAAAGRLLDRLEVLTAQYGPSAAVVDLTILRRDVDSLLEAGKWRHQQGWTAIGHLQEQAAAAVGDGIGAGGAGQALHLDRAGDGAAVVAAARSAAGTIVHGESGTGKSALVLEAVTGAAAADPCEMQAVFLNLRHLPEVSLDLVTALGCPLQALLGELSAPARLLVIDAADAALETRRATFAYLVSAARDSGVNVVAITAAEGWEVVRDLMAAQLGEEIADYRVSGLSNGQLEQITTQFPELGRLAANGRSRELLRRLVVVDLLVRSNMSALPLSDVDAMQQSWAGLVRRHEQRDHGLPDAREQVLLTLAARELSGGPAIELAGRLDAAAVGGLRQDGLLRAWAGNPWQVLPDFAHDEVRRYALARVLLANGDPAAALLAAGAPRWALPAGRLACQALLAQPDHPDNPLHGRLGRVQAAFDGLVAGGHGARWGDVAGEALLTLGDPGPLLTDAWAALRGQDAAGLGRLLRLVDQRHRRDAFIDPVVAEPVVALLLDEAAPWQAGKKIARLLREWLAALVAQDSPEGNLLRVRMRERLAAACAEGQQRLDQEQEAAAAARAARTPEEIEEDRQLEERHRDLLGPVIGRRRHARRHRPPLPCELTDDTILELLALLGPDLGEVGEELLRRVARDEPWQLAPAVEQPLTGRALVGYRRGLLADLTEAYYLDEEEDGSGFHEDGVRDHHWRGPITPLAAWYRGPFMPLFQNDLRGGVAVLNKILNHAALARARTLAGLGNPWAQVPADAAGRFKTELRISGASRIYAGDSHVWTWYRGTGVGPYPCMSALQALERFCDQLIAAGLPLDRIVALLLDGCENLAMAGLVVGLLVRHLDNAGTLLHPYLAEPAVWELEFARVVGESSPLAAGSDELAGPGRRKWTFLQVAAWLVVHADADRVGQLRSVGTQLIAAASQAEPDVGDPGDDDGEGGSRGVSSITLARRWAGALDRDQYHVSTENGSIYIQYAPPEDVQAALQPGNEDLERGREAMRLVWRYVLERRARPETAAPATPEALAADLKTARELLGDPSAASPVGLWDAPAAVAAAALEAHLLRGTSLPADLLEFAVETVLVIAEAVGQADQSGFEESYFEQGADRVAARALPLLLLPAAEALRDACGAEDGVSGKTRVTEAGTRLARASASEVRLYLARGLDPVWEAPCRPAPCHHEAAFGLAVESMRDCVLGGWDTAAQRRRILRVSDPVAGSLARVADDVVLIPRLDAAIRALGAAAARATCVQGQARELLMVLLGAQRRGLLASEHDLDDRGSHALVAARALLSLAAAGDEAPLREHIESYADNGTLLGSLLRALSAAAEETPSAAQTARQAWPGIITQVMGLITAGHHPFSDDYFGQVGLASVIPVAAYDWSFLYREIESAPIAWTDALAWRPAIEAWLEVAAGRAACVDSLIGLVRTLPAAGQAQTGLPWVTALVLADTGAIAGRSPLLSAWLIEIRSPADDAGMLDAWQELVDALVVAGDTRLAPYSE